MNLRTIPVNKINKIQIKVTQTPQTMNKVTQMNRVITISNKRIRTIMSSQTPKITVTRKQMTMLTRMMHILPLMKNRKTEKDHQIQQTMMSLPIRQIIIHQMEVMLQLIPQTTIQEVILIRQQLTTIQKNQKTILTMKRLPIILRMKNQKTEEERLLLTPIKKKQQIIQIRLTTIQKIK
jgi:uncharacterized membrane protein YccC